MDRWHGIGRRCRRQADLENTGGAGGFYTGMKWAYEHGADAIWIMDDDTIPQADALQKLLDGMMCAGNEVAPQDEIGFVSSTVLWTDGSPCQMNRIMWDRK